MGVLLVLFAVFVGVILFSHTRFTREIALVGIPTAGAGLFLPSLSTPLLRTDGYAVFFTLLFMSLAFLVILSAKRARPVYYGSILLSTMGMILAASATDLVILYLGIELATVPVYVLVAYGKTRDRMEAGVKYFVVSMLASAFLLLGIGLLSVSSGTALATLHLDGVLGVLGLAGILTGLGFKMGLFPFNAWIPDVYQGAPPEIAGFLAGASKKAGFAAFISIIAAVHLPVLWRPLILMIAALSMTIPNLIALVQTDVRRMLAYSIMTHAGFLFMGLVVLSRGSLSGLLVHAFVHGFMALGAFLVVGVFSARKLFTIEQFQGLGWRSPFLGISLTLFLLSLAGMPVLAGFMSKLYLFYAVLREGLSWIVLLAIVNSAISLYYYFRIIRVLYGYEPSGKSIEVALHTRVAVLLCVLVVVLLGLYPVPLLHAAVRVAGLVVP